MNTTAATSGATRPTVCRQPDSDFIDKSPWPHPNSTRIGMAVPSKADPEFEKISVMMISIAENKDLGYTLGAVESPTKPVDFKRLLGKIESLIG